MEELASLRWLLAAPDKYLPDSLDLGEDAAARDYWLTTLEKLTEKYVARAMLDTDPTSEIRALKFKTCYIEALKELRTNPVAQGRLTIRLLLDLNETCLRSQGFFDLWKQQKTLENEAALARLSDRLAHVDSIQDPNEKWTELCRGVLAGNMFDWGAQAVTSIMEQDAVFGLNEALQRIQKRPWLIDGLDKWMQRLELGAHRCAAIFVDNSGVDIVLGILPLARALVSRGTAVVLCANERPALNDVTADELKELVRRAALLCPLIAAAVERRDLVVRSNGQRGPCLDLRTLDVGLCRELISRGMDLVILEGMGRALHTNLHARLAVDSLKMAVVKNAWLAHRLGGPLFSVVFLYEDKPTETV